MVFWESPWQTEDVGGISVTGGVSRDPDKIHRTPENYYVRFLSESYGNAPAARRAASMRSTEGGLTSKASTPVSLAFWAVSG